MCIGLWGLRRSAGAWRQLFRHWQSVRSRISFLFSSTPTIGLCWCLLWIGDGSGSWIFNFVIFRVVDGVNADPLWATGFLVRSVIWSFEFPPRTCGWSNGFCFMFFNLVFRWEIDFAGNINFEWGVLSSVSIDFEGVCSSLCFKFWGWCSIFTFSSSLWF